MTERLRLRLQSNLPPLRGLLPLVLLIVLWQVLQPGRSPYFPPPSAWWTGLAELSARGVLLPAIGATLRTFAVSLALAAMIGASLGLLVGLWSPARRALSPLLEFCRAMPPPVVVPVAVLLIGFSEWLKLLVVTWAAIWPVLLNVAAAAATIDPLLHDVGRTFRLGRTAALRKITLPAIVPAFLLGLRVAMPLAVIVTLLVEMLTLLPGVGALIVTAQREFQSAKVYGLLVLVGLIGFALNALLAAIEAAVLRRWPPRANGG